MTDGDRIRWNERYGSADAPQAELPAWLTPFETTFPTEGRCVDIACGRGSITLWLATRGLTVDAIDVSECGLALLRSAVHDLECADRVRTIQHDLDAGLPDDGPFDVIVCTMFRAPELVRHSARRLRPNGLLVASCYSVVGASPDAQPRFLAERGELLAAADGLTVVHHSECDGVASLLAQLRSEHSSTTEGT